VKAERKPRPRERQRVRNRWTILAAARELILEGGVETLSLRGVAERAGYSPAGLYEYFDGKDELLRALAADVAQKLDARLATVPETVPPARRLVRLGTAYLAFARENPEDYLLLFSRLSSGRTSLRQGIPPGAPYQRVVAAIEAGKASGELAARVATEDAAYGLWALVHGMAMLQLTHLAGFDADFDAVDRRVIERFVTSLAA